jgi:uncharacterized protein involved in exopolysaccharide biosynthesis
MPQYGTNETYPQRSLRDFYYIVFRHKRKVFLFFLAVMIVVMAATFLATEIYRSQARIMVRIGRESVTLPPTATTGTVISYGLDRESEITSEKEILGSRDLAEKVVDEMGPEFFLARHDDSDLRAGLAHAQGRDNPDRRKIAITQFVEHLKIQNQKGSNILAISYDGYGPKQAQQVLAKMVDLYLEKHIAAHRTPGSYEFFDKEVQQIRAELIQKEEDLKNLKNERGIASLEEKRKIVLEQIGSLQREVESTQGALATSQAKVKELKGKLAGLSPSVVTHHTRISNYGERIGFLQREAESTEAALAIAQAKVRELREKLAGLSQNIVTHHTKISNYGIEMMRSKLYELRLKEQDLLTRYTETSIPVQEIRRQIAEAQTLLDKEDSTRTEVTTGINMTYEEMNRGLITEMANVASLEAKLRVVKSQLQEAQLEPERMRTKLHELKRKEKDLLTKGNETGAPVQEIRRQIAQTQALLDKEELTRTEVTTGINGTYEELNRALVLEMATVSSLVAKLKVVEGQLKEARKETGNLIVTEAQMVNLQRELALLDAKYRKYSENLEQARIEQALEMKKISNISVIEPATAPMDPVRPRKAVNLGLGLIFGVLGGIGLAFFSHFRDHSLKTPQDIEEKLGLQPLASIPCLEK